MKIDLSDLNLVEKERRILESAVEIFSEKGFSASTTNEISKHANVAEGTIFKYFKTKKNILRRILILTIDLFSKRIVVNSVEKILSDTDKKSFDEILYDLFYDRINIINKAFPLIRIIIAESFFHNDIREAINNNIISRVKIIAKDFYINMVNRGHIRNDICFDVVFRNILGNLGAYLIQKKLFQSNYKLDQSDLDQIIDVIVNGITKK